MPDSLDRRPSPVPALNAPTNNPFRRGAGSPQLSPPIRSESPPQRPNSNNPFLDSPFEMNATETRPAQMSPPKPADRRPVPRSGENEALLVSVTLGIIHSSWALVLMSIAERVDSGRQASSRYVTNVHSTPTAKRAELTSIREQTPTGTRQTSSVAINGIRWQTSGQIGDFGHFCRPSVEETPTRATSQTQLRLFACRSQIN